jgi:hypothetical protein
MAGFAFALLVAVGPMRCDAMAPLPSLSCEAATLAEYIDGDVDWQGILGYAESGWLEDGGDGDDHGILVPQLPTPMPVQQEPAHVDSAQQQQAQQQQQQQNNTEPVPVNVDAAQQQLLPQQQQQQQQQQQHWWTNTEAELQHYLNVHAAHQQQQQQQQRLLLLQHWWNEEAAQQQQQQQQQPPHAAENCAICCQPLANASDVLRLVCNHVFHDSCVAHYMHVEGVEMGSMRCPECRTSMDDLATREGAMRLDLPQFPHHLCPGDAILAILVEPPDAILVEDESSQEDSTHWSPPHSDPEQQQQQQGQPNLQQGQQQQQQQPMNMDNTEPMNVDHAHQQQLNPQQLRQQLQQLAHLRRLQQQLQEAGTLRPMQPAFAPPLHLQQQAQQPQQQQQQPEPLTEGELQTMEQQPEPLTEGELHTIEDMEWLDAAWASGEDGSAPWLSQVSAGDADLVAQEVEAAVVTQLTAESAAEVSEEDATQLTAESWNPWEAEIPEVAAAAAACSADALGSAEAGGRARPLHRCGFHASGQPKRYGPRGGKSNPTALWWKARKAALKGGYFASFEKMYPNAVAFRVAMEQSQCQQKYQ